MKQSEIPPCAPLLRAAMPMLLGLSLTACATPPAPPVAVCPANPPAPALSEPIPQGSYSERVRLKLKSWHESLTPTQTTPAR